MIDMLYDKFKPWAETGSIWVYSDTHFDDPDCKLMAEGWPSPQQQIKIINQMVQKTDTFVLLGDVGNPEYIQQIKASKKILIAGNHDKGLSNYKKKIIKRIYDADEWGRDGKGERSLMSHLRGEFPVEDIYINTSYEFHSPFVRYNVTIKDKMFDEVYGGPLFIADKILLSHEPINLGFGLNIHGHDHGNVGYGQKDVNHFCVCSNTINYIPVRLDKIIKAGYVKDTDSIHRIIINEASKNSFIKYNSSEL